MKEQLLRLYERESFAPGPLGFFVNPFYFARRDLRREIALQAGAISGRVLDVGCGTKPYRELFRCTEYCGLEYDSPENRAHKRADAFYDGHRFPFADASFDSVVCFEVLEHVPDPIEFLSEVKRVLRPGGALLLTMPFLFEEHEAPLDFQRYTRYGLDRLLRGQGWQLVSHRTTVPGLRVLSQQMASSLVKWTQRSPRFAVRVLMQSFFAGFINLWGTLLGWLPVNPELYQGHVVLVRK